jgi:hypothetical protein
MLHFPYIAFSTCFVLLNVIQVPINGLFGLQKEVVCDLYGGKKAN